MSLTLFDTFLAPGANIGKQGFYQKSQRRFLNADFSRPGSGSTVFNAQGHLVENGEDVPDWSYDNGCPVLKMREQVTNLAPSHKDLTLLINRNSTIISNETTSPDGTQNMDAIIWADLETTSWREIRHTNASGQTKNYIASAFYKKKNFSTVVHNLFVSGDSTMVLNFDTEQVDISGLTGDSSYKAIKLSNGYWYLEITRPVSDGQEVRALFGRMPSGVTGDGVSGVYVWGVQLQQNNIYSGLVPSDGTPLTRSANMVTFNPISEGVLTSGAGTIGFLLDVNDDVENSGLTIGFSLSGDWFFQLTYFSNGGPRIRLVGPSGNIGNVNVRNEGVSDNKFAFIITWGASGWAIGLSGQGVVQSGTEQPSFNADTFIIDGGGRNVDIYKSFFSPVKITNNELEAALNELSQ